MIAADIVRYSDSTKVSVCDQAEGASGRDGQQYFRVPDYIDYWEGEESPNDRTG